MNYSEIIEKVSKELSIPVEVVDAAYKSSFEFIRKNITQLPLKENLSEEEFDNLRPNFNIPSLGKLCCTKERFFRLKRRYEYLNKLKEKYENKED